MYITTGSRLRCHAQNELWQAGYAIPAEITVRTDMPADDPGFSIQSMCHHTITYGDVPNATRFAPMANDAGEHGSI